MNSAENFSQIEKSWFDALKTEFQKPNFLKLQEFIQKERRDFTIYPPQNLVFNALNSTPLPKVKVVIIGQDPYHGANQANGLCFSVNLGVALPPSLKNIFKELESDLGIVKPISGDLSPWAKQGVLLLNATLTVRDGAAGSHQKQGWEEFTDAIIDVLNAQNHKLVFLLWGRFAQNKAAKISTEKHFLLKAAHPSPLAAYAGFFGCRHFSACNDLLLQNGSSPIDWSL